MQGELRHFKTCRNLYNNHGNYYYLLFFYYFFLVFAFKIPLVLKCFPPSRSCTHIMVISRLAARQCVFRIKSSSKETVQRHRGKINSGTQCTTSFLYPQCPHQGLWHNPVWSHCGLVLGKTDLEPFLGYRSTGAFHSPQKADIRKAQSSPRGLLQRAQEVQSVPTN